MNRCSLLLVLLVLLALALAGCGSSFQPNVSPPTPKPNPSPEPETDQLLLERLSRQYREQFALPSLSVGLYPADGAGREPWRLFLGSADRAGEEPLTGGTRMRIGSITKSFTVTVLFQLADEGLLSLDEPISTYLPQLPNGEATLEQMANMTSGLFNYTEDPEFTSGLLEDPTQELSELELLAVAERREPYFPPGAGWHYSNTNTVAIGMVVEQVTGRPLGQEMARRLFQPLGMSDTVYPQDSALPNPRAVGFGRFGLGEPLFDLTESSPTLSAGSGAVVSTLDDLAIWGRALASGTLLAQETHQRRLQFVDPSGCESCPDYDGYGSGIGQIEGWLGHTGDYLGYQALVLFDPASERVLVILINLKDFGDPTHHPTQLFRLWRESSRLEAL